VPDVVVAVRIGVLYEVVALAHVVAGEGDEK
jgi:hypothetical protein